MNIPKAIKELTRYRKEPYSNLHPYFSEAVDLGIEALKRCKKHQDDFPSMPQLMLPGETKGE